MKMNEVLEQTIKTTLDCVLTGLNKTVVEFGSNVGSPAVASKIYISVIRFMQGLYLENMHKLISDDKYWRLKALGKLMVEAELRSLGFPV